MVPFTATAVTDSSGFRVTKTPSDLELQEMVDAQVATPCQIAASIDTDHGAYAKRVLVCRGLTLSCWRLRLGGKSAMSLVRFRMKAIHSGRFILNEIRH